MGRRTGEPYLLRIIEPGAFLSAAAEGLCVSPKGLPQVFEGERLPSAPVPRKEPGTLSLA